MLTYVRSRLQILPLILSEFNQIKKLLSLLRSSENHRLFSDLSEDRSQFAWIRLILEARLGDDPLST